MNKTGDIGEQLAADYLLSKNYHILARNWRGTKELKAPEIDIIAQKDDTIVFLEVKTSSTGKFGSPREKIDNYKRKRIAQGAQAYLAINNLGEIQCRFDAIIVDKRQKYPKIIHIENAFTLNDIEN